MWQDVIAVSIVGATGLLMAAGAVRNHRRGRVSTCDSCDNKNPRKPGVAPSYIIPMESLEALAPKLKSDQPDR